MLLREGEGRLGNYLKKMAVIALIRTQGFYPIIKNIVKLLSLL